MSISAYKVTPRQARAFIIEILMAGLVPFLQSSPAMGKSSIIRSIIEEFNMIMIDQRLSTAMPEDLTGLPFFENGIAKFMPFDTFPLVGTEIPNGKLGWIIFLDEFNSASKAVQAAAYKLLLDRMVGQHHLHEKVMLVAAGNLDTDRAITHNIGTALQSRLVHLEMVLDFDEFMEDVAYKYNWDTRICAYLNYKGLSGLHDFSPDHNNKTFCSPRTWEFVNKLIQGKEYHIRSDGTYTMDEKAALYAGAITSGVAIDFINFTRIFNELPKLDDIVRNPETIQVPNDPAVKFAVVSFLIEKADDKNFEAITKFINRFTSEFRVVFFRALLIKKNAMKAHPAFKTALLELSRWLHD